MASALIKAIRTVSGNQPEIRRIIEEATQAFLEGTPVQVNGTDGGVQAWDGTTYTSGIAGVAKEPGSSLSTTGTRKFLTFGSVPNEASAVNIPRGAPYNDGKVGFEVANNDSVFYGQIGSSQTSSYAAQLVGGSYGLTKDSDNHWYVDLTKTLTSGGGSSSQAVLKIVKLDPIDTTRGVHFVFLPVSQQLLA